MRHYTRQAGRASPLYSLREVAGASEDVDVRWGLLVAMLGSIALTGVATRRLCTRR